MLTVSAFSLLFLFGFASAREQSPAPNVIRGRRQLQTEQPEQTVGIITVNGDPVTFSANLQEPAAYAFFNECLLTGGTIPAGTVVKCTVESCSLTSDPNRMVIALGMSDDVSQGITWSNSTSGCPVDVSYTFPEDATAGAIAVASVAGNITTASLRCTSDNFPEPITCFSGETFVQVQGKGAVQMKDVQINDYVFVGAGFTGKPMYQPVYAFGHDVKDTPSTFLQIHTTPHHEKPLEISAAHLLYVEGKSHPVRADSVRIGDKLIQETVHSAAKSVEVTKINIVVRYGAYMPLTKDGPIIVNGIKTSSYVSIIREAPALVNMVTSAFSEDQLLHWWLAPYRMVCRGFPSVCDNDKNTEGISYWLVFGKSLAKMANGWGAVSQIAGLALVGLFLAFCMGLEAFTAFYGTIPSAVAAVTLVGFAKKMMRSKNSETAKKLD